jgi:hypothetical protein
MIEPSGAGAIAIPSRPYVSTQGAARATLAALAVVVVVDLIAMASDIAEIRLLNRAIGGEFISGDEFDRNDARQGIIGLAQTVLAVLTAIIYLVWQYRTHANLPALRAIDLHSTPRWSVIAWFIPILNVWRPYQITAEMARASDPRYLSDDGVAWQAAPAPGVLGFWWAAWLVNGTLGRIAIRLVLNDPQSLEQFRTESFVWLASDSADAVTALLAMLVVLRIAQSQAAKHRKVRASRLPPEPETPPGHVLV